MQRLFEGLEESLDASRGGVKVEALCLSVEHFFIAVLFYHNQPFFVGFWPGMAV